MQDGEIITIVEVLHLAKDCGLDANLEIHIDSDYSGEACYRAKKWFEDFMEH